MDNIYEYVREACLKNSDKIIIIDEQGNKLSYDSFLNQVDAASDCLNQNLITPFSNFSIIAPNCPNYLYILFALLKDNKTAVNLNFNLSNIELSDRLIMANVSVLFTTDRIFRNIASIMDNTNIQFVVIFDEIAIDFKIDRIIKLDKSLNCSSDNNKPAFLQFTGGTTGIIKAATISHTNVLNNINQLEKHFQNFNKYKAYILLITFPFYHIFCIVFNFLFFIKSGSKLIMYKNLRDFPFIINALNQYEVSFIVAVNTWYNKLMQQEQFCLLRKDKIELCFAGGEYVPVSTKEKWNKLMHKELYSAYGLTETSSLCIISPLNDSNINDSLGIAIPDTEAILLDELNNQIIENNIPGEIALKGSHITHEYFDNVDETAKAFVNGWFKTGDVAIKINDKTFKIVDRKKDMISVSGNKVYPNEIEELLFQLNGVLDVAAVGKLSNSSGEEVVVCIVFDEQILSIDTIKNYCSQNLTRFKIPKAFIKLNDLPKTPIGKTSRKQLREFVNQK